MSVCRSLVDSRQRPNPDTGGKATAAAGDGQDRLKARCVTDAEGEGLPGLARALRRGKPDPAKASGYMATPAPVIRSAQASILAHRAARNVSASPGSGQWITERRAVTRKWR